MSNLMPSGKGTYYYGENDFGLPNSKPKSTVPTGFSRPSNRDLWSIGFESMWDMMERFSRANTSSTYPPYNILKNGDDFSVEIAVAGFTREDLQITLEDNLLQVVGNKAQADSEYVHKGIGARNFTHKFLLGEHVEIQDARLDNGILTIDLYRNIPEDKKPRVIEIA